MPYVKKGYRTAVRPSEAESRERDEARRGYTDSQTRLSLLRGLPCPACHLLGLTPLPLVWTGLRLVCDANHGYSSPDALSSDIRRVAGTEDKKPNA